MTLEDFFARMGTVELASYLDIAAQKATADDSRACFREASRRLMLLRESPATNLAGSYDAALGRMARGGYDAGTGIKEVARAARAADIRRGHAMVAVLNVAAMLEHNMVDAVAEFNAAWESARSYSPSGDDPT